MAASIIQTANSKSSSQCGPDSCIWTIFSTGQLERIWVNTRSTKGPLKHRRNVCVCVCCIIFKDFSFEISPYTFWSQRYLNKVLMMLIHVIVYVVKVLSWQHKKTWIISSYTVCEIQGWKPLPQNSFTGC